MNMNIALVSHLAFPPYIGGVEKYVYNIAKILTMHGNNVEIFSTNPQDSLNKDEYIDQIHYHRYLSISPFKIYYFSPSLQTDLFLLKNFDIVHANAYGTFPVLASALAKGNNNLPLIVQPHFAAPRVSKVLHQVYGPTLGKYVFDICDKVILVSQAELTFLPMLNQYTRKSVCIPNGVDFEIIDPYYSGGKLKDFNSLNIVCVSRLEKNKGVQHVLYLLNNLKDLYPFHLDVIGEGSYRHELEQITKRLGLNEEVQFLGRISEDALYNVYARANILFALSDYESHSFSLIEAMAFGVVPIATRVGGNRFTIDDCQNGILAPFPVNLSYMKSVFQDLITHPSYLMTLSSNARKKAMLEFNIRKNVMKLIQLYEAVIAEQNHNS